MKINNKHRGLVLSSTFVGLVCGLVLTHQQAYAAQTPPVSNQQSQITTVSDNNPDPTAALNPRSYSSNISHPTPVSYNVTPSTYSSPETTATAKQEPASSDATADAPIPNTGATVPVANDTATSTNPGNNNSTNPATSSPTPDSGNSANTPVAASDNQTNGNSNTTTASSEQPETNIIAQGTWGTSKWDYTQEGADYILHLHAGTLGTPEGIEGIGRLNAAFDDQLTKIIIDPGVIANQNSRGLFSFLYNLKTIQGLENLDTSQVTDMSYMFFTCMELTNLDLSSFDTSQVTDMSAMFFNNCYGLTSLDVSHFNTSRVTNMDRMFGSCPSLLNLDVSHFDTSQVTNMSNMFLNCFGLTSLDVSHFDTSQVTNMSNMFNNCLRLTSLDVSHFNTSKVTDMKEMFASCGNLTNLDVSHFDTSKVTDMSQMFYSCSNLPSLNVSHFDTSQVTSMSWMFRYCGRLTNIDVSGFDTSKATDMSVMFAYCNNLTSLDLSSFDTSKVTDAAGMFDDCNNLHHLVLGPKIQLIARNGWISDLPAVPAAGTKIPGTDKIVTAPYWVATSGYQQGQRYTSDELQQLTGRDQVTTYDWDSQVPYQDTVESKSVTRTINVHYPDGQVKTIQDTVDLSRKVKVKADGSKTYGEWSTAQWEAYTVPELAGYQANQSKIPAQTVDSNTTDTTIDILYEPLAQTIVIQYLDQGQVVGTQKLIGYTGETLIPNYHAPQGYEIISSPQPNITVDATGKQIIQVNVSHKITQSAETLTKTRTINIHLPNATVKTYRQASVIKRNVAVDQVTGSKTYGPWHNNSWDAMDIPIIEGYTANQNSIAAQEVTAETENETIDIFYLQN
ncbi:BspA family leucine-rich repeat surface protein [Lactobacillus mellis]|uniref:BspA family leucine-rich repeat surface protein n=1 Tax=Bombilactobacillus mellis TaxID=1218508 RepID=UPI00158044C5|nr:BspA family leucine-rich repeat surface protein [Bombilactobacillus mellis]NUG67775.1 BspA family leucine-rich repeat surface protein [Bombilactobacillus mellis]